MNLKSPFLPQKSVIRSVVPMTHDNYLFEFRDSVGHFASCKPGQFVELWVPGVGEAPISVCSGSIDGNLQLLIRKVGRVTSALFDMQEGDWVGLRGPYGQGFPVEKYKGKDVCMVAGGLGVAPMRSLWQYILDHREDYGNLILIYGMRHSIDLLFRAEFKQLLRRHDIDVFIAAEEIVGPDLPPMSVQLGRVTDMVRLSAVDAGYEVAICGPPVMYKYVVQELEKKSVPDSRIWLSLERHMKCGIGKCGHCFIGGEFTCKEGPVFQLSELRMLPEVIECEGGAH
ncbi:MAG: FAD/NAD(P)-binding protein [Candidatus Obscuribacterales bacterium]|nr:FAD/NAD(P)-binding protein [Candidatus Obscuribacterales bacterium]